MRPQSRNHAHVSLLIPTAARPEHEAGGPGMCEQSQDASSDHLPTSRLIAGNVTLKEVVGYNTAIRWNQYESHFLRTVGAFFLCRRRVVSLSPSSPGKTAERSWNRWKRFVKCRPPPDSQRRACRWCPAEEARPVLLSRLFCGEKKKNRIEHHL